MKRRSQDPRQLTFYPIWGRPRYGRHKPAKLFSQLDVRHMTDAEILAIPGVGPKTLEWLRREVEAQ